MRILVKSGNGERLYTIIDDEDYERVSKYKWHYTARGYVSCCIYIGGGRKKQMNKVIYLHRLIIDAPKGRFVDHINRDRLDNRKVNLRLASVNGNAQNASLPKNNTSGYKGVSWSKDRKKWEVSIGFEGKLIHLGRYNDKVDAAKAYNRAALKYHGEFANLNTI